MDISLVGIVAKLLIVLGLIVGCFYLYSLISRKQQTFLGSKDMQVKSVLAIDQRNKVVIVDLRGSELVLFIGPNNQFIISGAPEQAQQVCHVA